MTQVTGKQTSSGEGEKAARRNHAQTCQLLVISSEYSIGRDETYRRTVYTPYIHTLDGVAGYSAVCTLHTRIHVRTYPLHITCRAC